MDFQYKEDKEFFINFLANGDEELFNNKYASMFDFRDPKEKRAEFNLIRNEVFNKLIEENGKNCQLKITPECMKSGKFHVDHFIPLSSNELNKKLRHMKRMFPRKVSPQSFGSNNYSNFRLACEECNSFKKHRFIKETN